MQVLFLIIGMATGVLIGFMLQKNKNAAADSNHVQQLSKTEQEKSTLAERSTGLQNQLSVSNSSLEEKNQRVISLNSKLTEQQTININLAEKLNLQKEELEKLQTRFSKEFENLANKILEEKSAKFTEQNKTNLDIILNPLKEKILEFEKKVDASYKTESAERNSLKGEIKNLILMNAKISEEANNLAKALKGDTKKQGNWGEVILEKILERSGLQKDVEYKTQVSTKNEEGSRQQPDVVIYLPDNKQIIIDSKVSLIAYEQFVNAADDDDREKYLKEHVGSVKNHIRILSDKNYQASEDFFTVDFVLLFMPIESSFSIAVQGDNELFSYAWEKKIVIVSPTTLLATLLTISSIWKHERQTRNALEIAEQSGKLYDKFVSFIDDLIAVGKKMDEAKSNYSEAMKKLSEGNGNLVSSTEKLKKLGAKTKGNKNLPPALLERAEENSGS